MKFSRLISLLLLSALTATACGGANTDEPAADDTQTVDTTIAEPKPEGYAYYEGEDFGGETLTVYNVKKDLYKMICVIQPDEITGEPVNDAIFERNEFIKEKLNCAIEEINAEAINDMPVALEANILANDDTYDAVYMPMHHLEGGMPQGYYYCLNDIETIHFDESYWDQIMLDSTSIRGKNYFATSSAHLMGWDSLWCVFFNKQLMDNNALEYPYQLARDGEWTIDKLTEYCKVVANLNGDESFTKASKNATFGFTSYQEVISKLIYGCDALYMEKNEKDEPVIAFENEHFVNVCLRLSELMSSAGLYLNADTESLPDTSYVNIYKNQQSLFLGAEVKMALQLRDLEQPFGIVPMPKYDTAQENYCSTAVYQLAVFTIPITNKNPERVGLLFDAISYESDVRVLPLYFNVLVEQKGLRDQESIEMLNIIKETRSFDIGIAYRWAASLEALLRSNMLSGSTEIASSLASGKSAVLSSMEALLDALK